MATALLKTHALTKRFGGLLATDRVSLDVQPGELHALIGPNGAGKTTLLAQLSGELRADNGTIAFAGEDITDTPAYLRSARGIARSFQVTSVFPDLTVIENIVLCILAHAGHSFRFWQAVDAKAALRKPAEELLSRLGLGSRAHDRASTLSHGGKRALEFAMALACKPKLLLLDEPMAGMGAEDSAQMVQFLSTLKGRVAILLVEHDMDAVFALADRITVLVYGRAIATGRPQEIRQNKDVQKAYLGTDQEACC